MYFNAVCNCLVIVYLYVYHRSFLAPGKYTLYVVCGTFSYANEQTAALVVTSRG